MDRTPFPSRFPIFPLPEVVLFPDAALPLRMFEPRYRALTRDAIAGDGVIGMTLLREGTSAPAQPPARVFDVGCAGVITRHSELPDGTYVLLLEGRRRFHVLEQEPTPDGYILASVELLEDPPFERLDDTTRGELSTARAEVERRMLEYARLRMRADVERLRGGMRRLDAVALVHALSSSIDATMPEKQKLLEASDPLERARLLIQLLDFHLAAARLPQPHDSIN